MEVNELNTHVSLDLTGSQCTIDTLQLASIDESNARDIVQAYLDSNSSIRAMPLSHRQVIANIICFFLIRGYKRY